MSTAQNTDIFPRIAGRVETYAAWAKEADAGDNWRRMAQMSLAAQAADAALDMAVQQAREAGRTWQEIAAATGLKSKQAAQQRWGKPRVTSGITPHGAP